MPKPKISYKSFRKGIKHGGTFTCNYPGKSLPLEVTVYPNKEYNNGLGDIVILGYQANWSALGSQPQEITEVYGCMLRKAAAKCRQLDKAFIGKSIC